MADDAPVEGNDRRTVPSAERIRVLWLAKGLGPGGMERLLVHHARFADHDAFAYQAAYLRPDKNHLVPTLAGHGVPATCLDGASLQDLRWAGRLRALVKRERIDVVHVHSPAVAAIARVVCRTMRPRPHVVYTEHNMWSSYDRATRIANRLTYALDDAHVAVSEQVRDSAPKRVQRHLASLVHGIDIESVRAQINNRGTVRAELGIASDEVLIGTVANFRTEKAYPDLLAAARIVTDAMANVKFVSIGQGHLEAEIRAEHARIGLGDRFRFLGYQENATRLMAAFDIFTLASHFEGLPVTLMEARALGLPVVLTRVGGLRSHVRDGIDGILVERARPDQLGDALAKLAGDPARRHALAAASAAAADGFDARTFTAGLEDIYRRVASLERQNRR